MPRDFSAKQIRASQLIASGGNGHASAGLLIYSAADGTNYTGGYPSDLIANIGPDVFLFVSGAKDGKQNGAGVTLFGGDIVISGTMYAERSIIEVDVTSTGSMSISGSLFVSRSADINEGLKVNVSQEIDTENNFIVYSATGSKTMIATNMANNQVFILSGGGGGRGDKTNGTDVGLFVSGTIGLKDSSEKYGTALFGGDFVTSGNLHVGEYIYHLSDTDTFIKLSDDAINVEAGGVNFIKITEDGSQDSIVFNEGDADVDFRVESLNGTHAIFVDASADNVHINQNEAAVKTQIHNDDDVVITVLSGTSGTNGVVFNEDGHANIDFRVESNGEDEAIYLDSSENTLYINKGETAFTTIIGNNNDEALRIDANSVVINEDGNSAIDFRVESNNRASAILVSGSTDQVLILSGGAIASTDEATAPDVAFYVSGSVGLKNANNKSVSVFGGDTVVSGGLYVNASSNALGDFRVESNSKTHAVFVDASTDQVVILSGGAGSSPNELAGTDIAFFVSGTIGAKDSAVKGTALFGGDVATSGSVSLTSDSKALNFGAGNDVTFTHDGGTGMDVVAAGAFDITAGAASTIKTSGNVNLTVQGDASLVLSGATIDIDADAGALSLDGSGGINIGTEADVAIDMNASTLDIDTSGAITIDSTSGLSIDVVGGSNITTNGALTLSGSTGLNLGNHSGEIEILTQQGGIDIDATAGNITIDAGGTFSVDVVGASNVTTNGALTISGSTGLNLASDGGEIDVTARQGNIDINATAGNITVDSGGTFSVDAVGASNITTNGALTVSGSTGLNLMSDGGTLDIETRVGSIDIDSAGALTIDSATSIAIGANADKPIDIDSTTLDIDASGAITIDGTSTFSVDAVGTSNVTTNGALTISGSTGLNLKADSGTLDIETRQGAIDLDAGGALSLDSATSVDLGVANSGIAVTIGHSTSETKIADNLTVVGNVGVNGIVTASLGLSGSLTRLADGKSFIEAGTNITVTSASNGAITITAADTDTQNTLDQAYDEGGSGVGAIITVDNQPVQMRVAGASSVGLVVTGTVVIGSSSTEFSSQMPPQGTDVNFFVSGTIGSKDSAVNAGTSIFGGDTVVSGNIYAGEYIYHEGDTDTNIQFDADNVVINAGNTRMASFDQDEATIAFNNEQANLNFVVYTQNKLALAVGTANEKVLILSGGAASSPNEVEGTDINFFVSGAVGSRLSAITGSSLFGGDLVSSGSVYGLLGLSGSLTRLTNGASFIEAGANITVTSASNGAITIAGAAGSAGGSDTQVQFNDGGSDFGGITNLTTDGTDITLLDAGKLKIGTGGDLVISSSSDQVYFGLNTNNKDLIFMSNDAEVMRIDESANSLAIGVNANDVSKLKVHVTDGDNVDGIDIVNADAGQKALDIDSEGAGVEINGKQCLTVTVDKSAGYGAIFARNKHHDETSDPLVKIRDQDGDQSALKVIQESITGSVYAIEIGNAGGTKSSISGSGAAGFGMGTTAFNATLQVKSITEGDGIVLQHAGSTDTVVKLYDSTDDGIVDVYANNSVTSRIHGNGISYVGGDFQVTGANLDVAQYINHLGDLNTRVEFGTDVVKLQAGGVNYLSADNTESTLSVNPDLASFNTIINTRNKLAFGASNATEQVLILSGGAISSYDEASGADVSFYVSGSVGSRGTALSGSAVFGGDVVISGSTHAGNNILPLDDISYNLGSSTKRWANIFTGDLHLRNDRGDWTIVEEREYLSVRNNLTGKVYKMVLEPITEE